MERSEADGRAGFPLPSLLPELQGEVSTRFDRLSLALYALTSAANLARHEKDLLSPFRCIVLAAEGGYLPLLRFLIAFFYPDKAKLLSASHSSFLFHASPSDSAAAFPVLQAAFMAAIRMNQERVVRYILQEYPEVLETALDDNIFYSIGRSENPQQFKFLKGLILERRPLKPAPAFLTGLDSGSPSRAMLEGALYEGRLPLVKELVYELLSSQQGRQLLEPQYLFQHLSPSHKTSEVLRCLCEYIPSFEDQLMRGIDHLYALRNGCTETLQYFLAKGGSLDSSLGGGIDSLLEDCFRITSSNALYPIRFLVERGANLHSVPLKEAVGQPDEILDYLYAQAPDHFSPRRLLQLCLEAPRGEDNPLTILGFRRYALFVCWCCRTLIKETKAPCWRPPLPNELKADELIDPVLLVAFIVYTPGDKASLLAQVEEDYQIPPDYSSRIRVELVKLGILPEKDFLLELLEWNEPMLFLRGVRKGGKDIDVDFFEAFLDFLLSIALPIPYHFRTGNPGQLSVDYKSVCRTRLYDLGYSFPADIALQHPRFFTEGADDLILAFITSHHSLDPRILYKLIELNRSAPIVKAALRSKFQPPNSLSGEDLLKLALQHHSFHALIPIIKLHQDLDVSFLWEFYKEVSSKNSRAPTALLQVLQKLGHPFMIFKPASLKGSSSLVLNPNDSVHLAHTLISLKQADSHSVLHTFLNPTRHPKRDSYVQGLLSEFQKLEDFNPITDTLVRIQELKSFIASTTERLRTPSPSEFGAAPLKENSISPSFSFSSSPSFSFSSPSPATASSTPTSSFSFSPSSSSSVSSTFSFPAPTNSSNAPTASFSSSFSTSSSPSFAIPPVQPSGGSTIPLASSFTPSFSFPPTIPSPSPSTAVAASSSSASTFSFSFPPVSGAAPTPSSSSSSFSFF